MEKINLIDLQKRKLNKCYLSWNIITKDIYIRNNESCKEKQRLYIILGTDISGNRQVISTTFENTYDNRFWLEHFEALKCRGTKFVLFAVIPPNKNIERCIKIIYNGINIVNSPENIVMDTTKFFTEKSTRKFITNLKDLFFAKTLKDPEIEMTMFKEQFIDNKVVLKLLEKDEERIKKYYIYPYEIRKFLYPYYPIRDMKRELNKLNNVDNLCQNKNEINMHFLEYINKYESRRSYYRAEWLELLNIFYKDYSEELEKYLLWKKK